MAEIEFKCKECDRAFATPAGVQMHTQRMHQGMGPGYGNEVGNGVVKKEDNLPVAVKRGRPKGSRNSPRKSEFTELKGFKLLTDAHGGIWVAEKIK